MTIRLKAFEDSMRLVRQMAQSPCGKLLVYASAFVCRENRLKSVSAAAERIAELLKLNLEVVTFRKKFRPIYVYYGDGKDDPIPLYCSNGGKSSVEDVYSALRNMMFVLSFHPKHSALAGIRKEVMRFS